jgi:monofunctional biosynthetic peptidoglycan transglycosylase
LFIILVLFVIMNDILKRLLRIIKIPALFFLVFSIFTVILYRFLPPPITPLMIIRVFEQVADGKEMKLKKEWKPIDKISPNLALAVIASEDQLFLEHYGFDFTAIRKAFENNSKKKKKYIKGASTISQQVAKNVFLWPGRSWVRKIFEVYFTFLIEIFWSKERILEVYLNVVEMGDGIYGAQAASAYYFKKPALKYNQDEAALIAAILPNPRRWSPVKPTAYILKRKIWIKRNMMYLGDLKLNQKI